MLTAGDVANNVGALLNDPKLTRFTFDKQLPYINMAYQELGEHLQYTNVSMTNETSAIFKIPVGVIDIGGPTGPPLPADFVSPIVLYEKQTGTSEDFIEMTQKEFLPKIFTLTNALQYWCYQKQVVELLGALSPRDVQMDYTATPFIKLVGLNDQIPFINATSFMGFRSAALCAEFIGENPERADKLNGYATTALDRVLGIDVKEKQSIRTRRRPFRAGYKSTSYI